MSAPAAATSDLSAIEVRVLGCLVEKEATTPAAYPLTRNALRNACNQSTSRVPVMDVGEQQVESALLSLRDRRLARPVRNPGDRVTKFRHAMPEVWDLDDGESAVLAVLLLRGAQTVGELRTRTQRLHDFPDVDAVATVLSALANREPAMVAELGRAPGQKEARWLHQVGEHDASIAVAAAPTASTGDSHGPAGDGADVAQAWVAGASAVVEALADPAVAAAWDRPSVLADQTVSSLAGHLARGAVWVVGDYLDGDPAVGTADFASAGAYFAELTDALGDDDHAAVRNRGAAVGAVGHDHLVRSARARLADLAERIPAEDPDRLVATFGGLSIRLEDYLVTRIVEQVVHLDDLQRSVDGLSVSVPAACTDLAVATGLDVLRHRHGPAAPVRALFRREFREWVPVL